MVQVIRECVVEQEDTRKDGQLLFGHIISTHRQLATMLMDYQSLMVIHVNTSGHLPMDYLTAAAAIIFHVLLVLGIVLLPLLVLTIITVSQELLIPGENQPTTSMTHCGTDLTASLANAVTTLPNHGFTDS